MTEHPVSPKTGVAVTVAQETQLDAVVKMLCGCSAEWTASGWRFIEAATCDHNLGASTEQAGRLTPPPDKSSGHAYRLLTPTEVARLLGCSARTVIRLCDRDEIEHSWSGYGRVIAIDSVVKFAARRGIELLRGHGL